MLSIDTNGDVILVRDSVGSGGITNDDWHITGNGGTDDATNFIGTTDAQDFVVKTNDTEYMRVIGDVTNRGNVGIHTTAPTAVLHVVDDASASSNTAIYGIAENATTCKGVSGRSIAAPTTGTGYGGYFIGDYGTAGPLVNYGVYGKAYGGGTDYGGYFTVPGVPGDTTANRYAVYGETGNSADDYAAYFNGTGILTGGSWGTSDARFKKDITSITKGLDKLMNLSPSSYEFENSKFPSINLQKGQSFGLIAQEVEEIIPDLVKVVHHPAKYNDEGNVLHEAFDYKAVNYTGLIPFTIAAIQEQQQIIDEKEERIKALEKEVERLAQLEQNVERIKEQLAVLNTRMEQTEVMDVQVGVIGQPENGKTELHQNRPNPFRQVTTFAYTLGKEGKVELNIYSMDGVFIENVINRFQEKGEHKVEWDSKEIPNGMYFYILNVDGVEWVKKAIRLQ